jgi:flagellar protein FlgJ
MSDAIGPASPAAALSQDASPQPTKAQIHEAGQKFEALLLRQMLSESRKVDFGNTLFSDKGTETFREMQDSRLADTMAQRGTLGFARMIEAQLARQTGAGSGD